MAFGEVKDTTTARTEAEPPYEGRTGRTRLRAIHVPQANGTIRSVQVYDVVNVGTHPQLRQVALSGELHRFEGGDVLAIPFVYHDPSARKLALVIPEPLRHQELSLRAKLLSELAEDADALVPAYVRDATAVIGPSGLRAYLDRTNGAAGADLAQKEAAILARESQVANRENALRERDQTFAHLEAALRERETAFRQEEMRLREQRDAGAAQLDHVAAQREQAVAQREAAIAQRDAELDQRTRDLEAQYAALSQREQRLSARAEDVTRREDELVTAQEEIEAAQADVAMREQELESRFEMLRQREVDLGPRDAVEKSIRVRDQELVQVVDDEVEEMDELEPLATSPGNLGADELGAAVELIDERGRNLVVGGASDVATIDADDDVEEIEDIEPIETGVHRDLPGEDTDMRARDRRSQPPPPPPELESEPPVPSVAPPPEFFEGRHGSSVTATTTSEGVRLFVRLPEGKDEIFAEETELLAQLVIVEEYPVVLLSIVEARENRPQVLRAALDPRDKEDRGVLEKLRRRFAATIALFSSSKRYLRSFEVSAPRELNVAAIIERVARLRPGSILDQATAIERALSAPPPVRTKDHPFADDAPAPVNAREAKAALDQITEWASPEKMEHALLVLSIPRERVDAKLGRVLETAAQHGLGFEAPLVQRAVSLGVATDPSALVAQQIDAFEKTCERPDRGGLTPEDIANNWERLLKSAAEHELAIDASTHDYAWRTIREVRGGDSGEVDLGKLGEAGVPELVLMLEHPRYRRDAALELCRRKEAAVVETVCKSVRKMPRAEVVRVVPRLVPFGDDIGDALVDGLGARKTFVRQAFALALGHMKLRRAVVPLLHLMSSEESEVWREVARIVGSFGNASLRAVTTQLREPKGREERYLLCLAHLANHGCQKQVEKLVTDERPSVATMAREALTLRDRARQADEQARGVAPLQGGDAILEFSRRFYQELEGKAPEHDLEDPSSVET